jgi:dTDP-glucose pyrophosphorylase
MKKFILKPETTLKSAMKKFSKVGKKTMVIANDKLSLLGTLSDGDIRKAILNGSQMDDSISLIFQSKPTTFLEGNYTKDEAKKLFLKNNFDLIPVIDKKGILINILFIDSLLEKKIYKYKKINIPVVIMAGGKGTRLKPLTDILPKPLVPIQNKTIIEHIIENFKETGSKDFYLSINYKAKLIKAYFEEIAPKYNVNYVEEDKPLGTAGSLKYLDKVLTKPFFVTNCDVIVKANYQSLYNFHLKGNYDMTLVASAKEYVIPYGTCELNKKGSLSHIKEKPVYNFLVNTGLYVINPEILDIIPKNKLYDINQLFDDAKKIGKKIGVFPISEDAWFDVGQWGEYKNTLKKL